MRVDRWFVVARACGTAASRLAGGHGRAGLVAVSKRKPYKTDLSDEQ